MVIGKSLCPLPAILVLRHCKLSFLRSRLQTKAGFAPHNINEDEAEAHEDEGDEGDVDQDADQDDERDHKDDWQLDVVSESDHSNPCNDQHPQPIPNPLGPITFDVVPRGAMDTPQRTSRARIEASANYRHQWWHIAPMELVITDDVLE